MFYIVIFTITIANLGQLFLVSKEVVFSEDYTKTTGWASMKLGGRIRYIRYILPPRIQQTRMLLAINLGVFKLLLSGELFNLWTEPDSLCPIVSRLYDKLS